MDYAQVIKYAMQMELDGSNFFREKAGVFSNPTTERLFITLAETEMEHYHYLKRQLDSYVNNDTFDLSEEVLEREEDIFKARAESEHIKDTLKESDIPDLTIIRMAYLI